jgi:hypothetical protein
MAEQPSLTPHRDQVEKLLAKLDAYVGELRWQDQLARRLVGAIHRTLADERDAGRELTEIARCLPFLTHNATSALLGSCGMEDDLIPSLLAAAAQGKKLVGKTVGVSATMPKAAGGRA